MTPKQRASLRAALERTRAELVRSGPAKIEPNRTDPASTGVADEDAQALSEMMQVLASQRNRGQAELIGRIDRALRKLREAPEDYGLCEDCEEEIAPQRLAVVPWAPYCPACQAKRDPARGGVRKKLTDYR
ncbi:MAG TPA: TraR/DksA family transcriptional regulator [Anaeromyxobacteraceae bacterium]|nr:TraR/DksA family transcriptional regulator [Anaeromyxobacteraceae bacterium]